MMSPPLRKFALSAHLTFSVGWIGTVVVYLALSISAMTADDPQVVRSAWIAMDLTGWYVIVPLSVASWLTGIIMALGTRWGLLRHYWVLISFALTTLAMVVLIVHMPDVTVLARVAREGPAADEVRGHLYGRLQEGDLVHPGLGLVVLLIVQVLNMYKPSGLTRHGWRKQQQEQAGARRQALAEA